MRRIIALAAVLTAAHLLSPSLASAATPPMTNYQGRLSDSGGEPLDGTVSMTFTIYDASTAGTAWWSESHPAVQVDSGLFSVILGTTVPIDDSVFVGEQRWLEITVDGETITPRTRLTSVPYSHRVATIDSASGGVINGPLVVLGEGSKQPPGQPDFQSWYVWLGDPTPQVPPRPGYLHVYDGAGAFVVDIDGATGRVGVGTTNAAAHLHVSGSIYTLGGTGDANLNGGQDAGDMAAMLSYLALASMLSEEAYAEADMDGDGRVSWDDLAILERMLFGIDTKEEAWRLIHSAYGVAPATNGEVFYVRGRAGIATQDAQATLHDNGSIYTLGGSGDADLSGLVDAADFTLIVSYLAQGSSLSEAAFAEADLDGDGRVTWDDLAILERLLFHADTKEDAWRLIHASYGVAPATDGEQFYVKHRAGIATENAQATLHDNGSIYTLGGTGDANLDAQVSLTDLTVIVGYLGQGNSLTEAAYAEADLDGDGRVTWDDVGILNRILYQGDTKEDAWQAIHSVYGAIGADLFYVRGEMGIGTQDPGGPLEVSHDGTSPDLVVDAAGNVGIGTDSPQGALDVSSTTGALIVPRMTTAQRNALTAVNGMIIYNTSTDQFNFYEAGAWVTK